MEIKVKILSKCQDCDGQAYLPSAKGIDSRGEEYQRYLPCPACKGTGQTEKWIALEELQTLLKGLECPHEHVSQIGSFHFSAGEVWDDIRDICDDCGQILD
ncbi:MAG: hypothetical protein ACOYKH_04165 [Brevefilum fermentans]|jgi:hypothetical protein|uniref:Uncharacterized protein n=1 Tax=Candidatus Brevifilum fermentans TaxID=1986204 RepID=A0A1Y6K2Z9_9CHLR|nr:hypothetical protein [Brevefilum fermentans]MCZ2442830.1 hypothetical protein [Flavobacteriales bacterium]SMX54055.1 protein of unknown function [Brevefilum fermentans]